MAHWQCLFAWKYGISSCPHWETLNANRCSFNRLCACNTQTEGHLINRSGSLIPPPPSHTHTCMYAHTHTCAPAHTGSNHVTNITMYLQHQCHQIWSLLSLTCITCIYTHMLTYIIQHTILCKSRSSETNDSNWPNGYLRWHVYMIPLLSSRNYILKQFG